MMEEISAIQQRIADIHDRMASLRGNSARPGGDGSTISPAQANQNFESVLSQVRGRGPASETPVEQTTGTLEPLAPLPMGRRPYVPPASLGALPTTGTNRGSAAPLVPTSQQIVPIRTGGLSQYQPIIDRYAAANGLSPSLVKAVIKTESDGNPHERSSAGAMGLMQLMPDNVKEAGIDNPYDPEQNIAAGTKQLADMLKQYHGDLDLALAGYNAGPGNVRKYGGVPPFRETQNYIRKVRAAMGEE